MGELAPVAVRDTAPLAQPSARTGLRAAARTALWIGPAVAVMAFIFGYGLYRLASESLHLDGEFSGLENFQVVIEDPLFHTVLGHNARLLLALPVMVIAATVIAVLLFETIRGFRFHRAIVFLPFILPIPVVGVVFGQILALNGILNTLLRDGPFDGLAHDWLGQSQYALWSIGAVIVWKEVGFGVILILARLLTLPRDILDAARVDGAGFWRMHLRVTLPQVWPVIVFYAVIEAITLVSWVFNYVYVMTRGGPGDATQVAETYIYDTAFQYSSPELAAAAAVLLFGGALAMMIAFAGVQRLQRRSSNA